VLLQNRIALLRDTLYSANFVSRAGM
jgi:hypothetical protein